MKKLICVSLIKTIASCIVDLMTLKQKLISVKADASDPSNVDPHEYFIGNRNCAKHLGVSKSTVSKYAAAGLLKSVKIGQFACFKKSEVEEAVENVPSLKTIFEAKLTRNVKRVPAMTTRCVVADSILFILLRYQGMQFTICNSPKIYGDQGAIDKLCQSVIKAFHKIKPFQTEPEELG